MAGHGYQKNFIINKSKKLNLLNDNFFLVDPMPKKDLPLLLSSATIVVSLFIDLPEMENNSANKFFDGLASGKPIMLNYGGWQSKLIEKNNAGFIIPNDNPKKASEIINKYIIDKEKLIEMGLCSKKLSHAFSIEKNFSIFKYYRFTKRLIGLLFMKIKCLVCDNSNNLKNFNWSNYEIYNCRHCKLYFCPELVEIEGNSSPVDSKGIKMMENSFYKTEKIAFNYAKKRIMQYEKILERKCQNILI